MMKKVLSVVLALSLITGACTLTPFRASAATDENNSNTTSLELLTIEKPTLNSTSEVISKNSISSSGGEKRTMNTNISKECWSSTIESYIFENSQNSFSILDATGETIYVDTYDSNTYNKIDTKEIACELPLFGGFYSGEQYNYMVFGQSNREESNAKEVLRVVKYDKEFNRISSLAVKDCFTIEPFDAGSLRMDESNHELTIHTSRLRYSTEDGVHHQSQLTLVVDTENMRLKNSTSEFQSNHVSHSFNQFVKYDETQQVLVDHGDAYPRSVVLNKSNGSYYDELELFFIPGDIGANCTGVTVGGFEVSSNHYLVAINTIDHSKVSNYTSGFMEGLDVDERDIVLLISEKDNTDSKLVKQIYFTDYVNKSKLGSTPYLVKISNTKFAVLWEEYEYSDNGYYWTDSEKLVKYVFVDENGRVLSDILYDTEARLSADCQPMVLNGKIMWYVNNEDATRTLYSIDAEKYTKEAQTITVADFGEKTYGDSAFYIDVTKDRNSNLDHFTYSSDNTEVATVSASGKIKIVGVGEANISVTEAGNADYKEVTVTKKLVVNKKPVTVTSIDAENKIAEINGILKADTKSVLLDFDKIALEVGRAVNKTTSKAVFSNFVLKGDKAENYDLTTKSLKTTIANDAVVTVAITAEKGTAAGAGKYLKNSEVTVAATPNSGYQFDGWYDGNTLVSTSECYTFTAKDDSTLTAKFSRKPMTDVKENDWFAGSVNYVIENGLMNGVKDTEFAPNQDVTRAMLVVILYRADGEPAVNRSIPFSDVKADDYFANAVVWAYQNGIVSGINDTQFAPNEKITREQIATIIYRYAQYKGYDTSIAENTNILSYADYDKISAYAISGMQYAVGNGLIKGKTETTSNPIDTATRAEIATILQRFIEKNR